MTSYESLLKQFGYDWMYPPILIGSHALSYHNIKKPGCDLEVIASQADWNT